MRDGWATQASLPLRDWVRLGRRTFALTEGDACLPHQGRRMFAPPRATQASPPFPTPPPPLRGWGVFRDRFANPGDARFPHQGRRKRPHPSLHRPRPYAGGGLWTTPPATVAPDELISGLGAP